MNQAGKIARLELQIKDLQKQVRELTKTSKETARAAATLVAERNRTRDVLQRVLKHAEKATDALEDALSTAEYALTEAPLP